MKKLINDPLHVVQDMVEGLVAADGRLSRVEGHNVIVRSDHAAHASAGKVAIISGGGAGHEPAHAGYVGEGMLTAAVIGEVFTSPSVDAVLAALRTVTGPAGTLMIVKNYTGDRLNFGLAAEIARASGLRVEMVVVGDDVALEATGAVGRRGIAGTVFVHKVAGAAAAAGLSLAEVVNEASAASHNVFSMGLGLGPCIVPAAGKAGFELGADEVEYGLGIHGEKGTQRGHVEVADAMVDTMMDRLLASSQLRAGDKVAVLINNLGGSAVQELAIVNRHVLARLHQAGIAAEASWAGTFLSALEMPGCSVSLLRLDPSRLERLLAPTAAAAWTTATHPASTPPVKAPATDDLHAGDSALVGPTWAQPADADRFVACLHGVAAALREAESELTELDSIVGDGDIGLSLSRGVNAMLDALPALDASHPASVLAALSGILRRVIGGTSGPLYAVFMLRAAVTLSASSSASDIDAWRDAFRAGVEGVQDLGGGRAGDRTMLDALIPAADAIAEAAGRAMAVASVAHAAADAAQAGAQATSQMSPRLGRSSYLGDRTRGHADPGAVAVALWLAAIAETLGA
ncbi:dihydroxyacetone kinase subunit DhaL [Dyella sp.]|uniref:dihydroxyacetone kinase subunit DhaL n=1 Tax=Dyella sp. TaxID=1869338 RepID=UPI002ED390DD